MRGLRNHIEYLASASTGPTITGGTETTVSGYRYHTFTSSDATGLVVTGPGTRTVDYILVGGGGASGGGTTDPGNNGGGGAGGVLAGSTTLSAGNYPVIIGAGGTVASTNYPASRNGNPSAWSLKTTVTPLNVTYTGNGGNSSFKKMPRPAANGQSLYIGTGPFNPWSGTASYQNLPAYLLGQLCTVEVNTTDDAQITFNKSTRVYLMRDTTFTGVTLTSWTLYESGKNYLSNYGSTIQVYYRDFTSGTYAFDSTSALYFFVDTAAPNTTDWLVAQGGGCGGGYTNASITNAYSMAVWGGSGGGASQKTNWWNTYTTANTGDFGVYPVSGQGNRGGWQHTYSSYAPGPLSGMGGGGGGTRGPLNNLTPLTVGATTYQGVGGGGSAGTGYQWLNGSYYGGGGGGSTHSLYTAGVLQQPGGVGGGGNGAYYNGGTKVLGTDGSANTGGGGGGAGESTNGRSGGSGILIVRYPV